MAETVYSLVLALQFVVSKPAQRAGETVVEHLGAQDSPVVTNAHEIALGLRRETPLVLLNRRNCLR